MNRRDRRERERHIEKMRKLGYTYNPAYDEAEYEESYTPVSGKIFDTKNGVFREGGFAKDEEGKPLCPIYLLGLFPKRFETPALDSPEILPFIKA